MSVASSTSGPMEIFYSYAREDKGLRDELEKYLSVLKRQNLIVSWHDREIRAGSEWAGEISEHLDKAQVILLLVSPDFMTSDYCADVEVKEAMKRHEAGEAIVIPVILRPSDWEDAPFGKLQALPTDARPITRWTDRDEAFLDVARGIREAISGTGSFQRSDLPPPSVQQDNAPVHTPQTPAALVSALKNIQEASGVADGEERHHYLDSLNTDSSEHPLSFCQVREEEYVCLNGPLPSDYPKDQTPEIRTPELNRLTHKEPHNLTALCLSGGGAQSAAFSLGIIQGLARYGLLDKFHFLSTVADGGYIGGWLSAWANRHPQGLEGVTQELSAAPGNSPEPVRRVRLSGRGLSKRGLNEIFLSLGNVLLSWLVLIPLLVSLLLIPRLVLAITLMQPLEMYLTPISIYDPASNFSYLYGRDIFLALGYALGVWALTYIMFNRPSLREKLEMRSRFWRSRMNQGSFLRWCLLPLILASICLTTYWAWARERNVAYDEGTPFWAFLIFGISFTIFAWLIAAIVLRRRPKEIDWIELGALFFAGFISGIFFWALGQHEISSPVIGYDKLKVNFDSMTTQWAAWTSEWYACLAVPCLLTILMLTIVGLMAMTSRSRLVGYKDKEWLTRIAAWLLITILTWSIISFLVMFGPLILLMFPKLLTLLGVASGVIVILAARGLGGINSTSIAGRLVGRALPVLAIIASTFLIIYLSYFSSLLIKAVVHLARYINDRTRMLDVEWLSSDIVFNDYFHSIDWHSYSLAFVHLNILHHTSFWLIAALFTFVYALGRLTGRMIDINEISAMSLRRVKVVQNFLAVTTPAEERGSRGGSIGDLNMSSMTRTPFHLVNCAVEEREGVAGNVESFTISPLHSGSSALGYRRSARYGHQHGISLGTALTISGMHAGVESHARASPFVLFLLALINEGRGWWLGNPGPAGKKTFSSSAPKSAALPLALNVFGLANNRSPYLSLSRGSNFDNLGLYEMVARRVHQIVVVDASSDPLFTFDDLNRSTQRILQDLAVPIEFNRLPIPPQYDKAGGRRFAIGRIRYTSVDGPAAVDGIIIYIKPAIYGSEPFDVVNYAKANPAFPQEFNAGDTLSETQFESYRKLGSYTIDEMCDGLAIGTSS